MSDSTPLYVNININNPEDPLNETANVNINDPEDPLNETDDLNWCQKMAQKRPKTWSIISGTILIFAHLFAIMIVAAGIGMGIDYGAAYHAKTNGWFRDEFEWTDSNMHIAATGIWYLTGSVIGILIAMCCLLAAIVFIALYACCRHIATHIASESDIPLD